MEWLLAVATIAGGIAAVWFFWDKLGALFRRFTTRHGFITDLIAELKYNQQVLQDIKYTTALRTEAWRSAHTQLRDLPPSLQAQLGDLYRTIESAKDIPPCCVPTS